MAEEPRLDVESLQLLKRRAERLRHRAEESESDEGCWVSEFPLGGENYAVPMDRLVTCLPLSDVTPVPRSAPGVVGIMRWEGGLITVLSLASLLGVRGWSRDPAVLLVLRTGERIVAVDCEVVPRGLLLPEAPPSAPGRAGTLLHLEGRRPLHYIHVDALLASPEGEANA